jgi:hypothetical protein
VVRVAQLDRASDCGSEGRGFESRLSPFSSYGVKEVRSFKKTSDMVELEMLTNLKFGRLGKKRKFLGATKTLEKQ